MDRLEIYRRELQELESIPVPVSEQEQKILSNAIKLLRRLIGEANAAST
jgi:hypothetical protein